MNTLFWTEASIFLCSSLQTSWICSLSRVVKCVRPSEIFITGRQLLDVFFPPVCLSCSWHNSHSSELDWSEANFTLYNVYTNTALCWALSLSPPGFLLFFFLKPFQHPEVCAKAHTRLKAHSVCLCKSLHTRLLIHWGILYHTGRQITFHGDDTLVRSYMHRSSVVPEATNSTPLPVTATCSVCFNECPLF